MIYIGKNILTGFQVYPKILNFEYKNAAKRDSAGAVCNSSMGMLFLMYFILGGYVKYNFLKGGAR